MPWYTYFSYFVAGLFLMNAVPHLVSGVCGRKFQTPFAHPRGTGLSSAPVNTLWGLVNLAVGASLAQLDGHPFVNLLSNLCFFAGLAVMALALGVYFHRLYRDIST